MKTNNEFYELIKDIENNEEYNKLKYIIHHGITRYDHCMRVAYYTYLITKKLHLNYKAATRGAMLHDFFTDEVDTDKYFSYLRRHPKLAVETAKKHFKIGKVEENIIKTHMFPITFTPPKYLESWIVDLVDDVSAIYEKGHSILKELAITNS